MLILAIVTPDQAVSVGTGWITAIFSILGVLMLAITAFWAKYGTMISAIIERLNRHDSRITANTSAIQTVSLATPTPVTALALPPANLTADAPASVK